MTSLLVNTVHRISPAPFPVLLDVGAAPKVRSMWLPIWPIKRTEMNEIAIANRATDWRRLKALVLDSVSSPITKRVYNLGLDEFFAWYGEEPGRASRRQP